ncbi:receptor-transporting protein 3-like [Dendropsophus ebraccatus]|uniref:receptor-transporting protein 3-like n=1 Tax=Dendropsophus ebraccatus TaxID=150705 RepID=UPI003831E424
MDEYVWEEEFDYEIEERGVPGQWVLYEDEQLHMQERGVKYQQRTFGRFCCSGCKRWWNSAEVHVLFFMNLNRSLEQGTVKMRIFRQECRKCSFPKLEEPEISDENITRITKNLVNHILQVFYGQKKVTQDWRPEVYSNDMIGPHDREHCEACRMGICKWVVTTENSPTVTSIPAQNPNSTYTGHGAASVSTATYPAHDANVRYPSAYPTSEPGNTTASSPEGGGGVSALLVAIVAGIGALVLLYFIK